MIRDCAQSVSISEISSPSLRAFINIKFAHIQTDMSEIKNALSAEKQLQLCEQEEQRNV